MSKRNDSSGPDADTATSPYDDPTSAFTVPAGLRRVEDLDDIDPTELATTPLVVPSRSKLDRRPAGAQRSEQADSLDAADDDAISRDTSPRVVKRVQPRTPTPITELGGEPPLPLTKPLDDDEPYGDQPYDDSPTEAVDFGDVGATTEAFDVEPASKGEARATRVDPVPDVEARRGTLDAGLLLLRVAVGLIALAHGAQKLLGWWGGPGLSGFEAFLLNADKPAIGFAPQAAHYLSIVGPIIETGAGALLVLGLLTPLAASGLLGTMIIAATYRVTLHGSFSFFAAADGVEYELLLVVCAAALVLTGPGRIALDARWGWSRRPMWGSLAFLVIGIAGAITTWIVFNGVNPLR
ncbi:DoxX family protein [Gordonia sp. TBRC 11910]|uniref:DoxX family protein n=1 Tax=Gordonia asplenii TaxID=2725283 RepID=A0A848KY59_9ACTN|nr:DoxX family protein [Gordonia asplenii]NMO01363.1 DoxX family protein [Gordonia asplenii]